MGRYKTRELAHFGIDYIKAFINIDEENQKDSLFLKLCKNSNFYFIDYYGFSLKIELMPIATEKYNKFYTIVYNSISIGFIGFDGIKNKLLTPNNFLEITGQGLNIFGVDIFYFLFDHFKMDFIKFKRLDFCFDIFLNVDYFYNKILTESIKKDKISCLIKGKKKVETIYLGKKDNKKNNYQLLRIYDKIVDSEKKEKLFLYNDSRKDEKTGYYKDVTRFEVEIREDLAKFYQFDSLLNENIIFAKLVKSFYKLNGQFFKFLKFDDFIKYAKSEKESKQQIATIIKNGDVSIKPLTIYQEKIQKKIIGLNNQIKFGKTIINEKDFKHTKNMFLAYSKKLLNNGLNLNDLIDILQNIVK